MFSAPSLQDIIRNVESGFSLAFYGSSSPLRVSFLKILAKVFGGAMYIVVLLIMRVWKNAFVYSADAKSLATVHNRKLNMPHKPATYAHGKVRFSARGATSIAAGTILVEEDSGVEFELIEKVTISNNEGYGRIYALNPGAEGNVGSGCYFRFKELDNDYVNSIVADDAIGGGALVKVQVGSDVEEWGESVEDYRQRLLERQRLQPQGGATFDYVSWLMRFSFITNVWPVENWPTTNSVCLFVGNTTVSDYSISSADLAEARSYVTDGKRRPLTSRPIVALVTPMSLAFTVTSSLVTDIVRASALDNVKNLIASYKPGDTMYINNLREVIKSSTGDYQALVGDVTAGGVHYSEYIVLPKSYNGSTVSGKVFNVNNVSIQWVTR